ncbi:uncharacterized protein LOC107620233 [Arachis ipaensis]|uniref:uncharacterized protein LOC107620233 n=1 Tax=Arachis ipaensis TaxID=130454 RepID=UPI0007AF38BB|nr:uncharacterized protein LOC107620233 [Arachis ipaensis]
MAGNDPVDFMAALGNMVSTVQVITEVLGNQMNSGNGNTGEEGPRTLATFLKVHLPTFRGTTNPTETDNWLQAIEWALQAQQVPEEQWVVFATYQLQVRNAKELELLQLKQGQMFVAEYTNKFEELCQFFRICQGALEDFVEWKCIKYEGGLWSDILSSVGLMEIIVFSELVKKSRVAEEYIRKSGVEKESQRMPFQMNQRRNFAPRGRTFKRGGFVLQ